MFCEDAKRVAQSLIKPVEFHEFLRQKAKKVLKMYGKPLVFSLSRGVLPRGAETLIKPYENYAFGTPRLSQKWTRSRDED